MIRFFCYLFIFAWISILEAVDSLENLNRQLKDLLIQTERLNQALSNLPKKPVQSQVEQTDFLKKQLDEIINNYFKKGQISKEQYDIFYHAFEQLKKLVPLTELKGYEYWLYRAYLDYFLPKFGPMTRIQLIKAMRAEEREPKLQLTDIIAALNHVFVEYDKIMNKNDKQDVERAKLAKAWLERQNLIDAAIFTMVKILDRFNLNDEKYYGQIDFETAFPSFDTFEQSLHDEYLKFYNAAFSLLGQNDPKLNIFKDALNILNKKIGEFPAAIPTKAEITGATESERQAYLTELENFLNDLREDFERHPIWSKEKRDEILKFINLHKQYKRLSDEQTQFEKELQDPKTLPENYFKEY